MGVFNRLGYTYDSTKFGDGMTLSEGQKLTLGSPSPLAQWQKDDLSNSAVSGYFKNPYAANLASMTIVVTGIKESTNVSDNLQFATAQTEALLVNSAAAALLTEISSFTAHTDRMSNVTESQDKLTIPDYNMAMAVGRQVLSVTNQIENVQNNAPILGNFTCMTIREEVYNYLTLLTSDNTTLNVSFSTVDGNLSSNLTSTQLNTILGHVQGATNLMSGRRTADTSFYVNSINLVKDYQTVSQFTNLGVTSKYLIENMIGTDKLKSNLQQ